MIGKLQSFVEDNILGKIGDVSKLQRYREMNNDMYERGIIIGDKLENMIPIVRLGRKILISQEHYLDKILKNLEKKGIDCKKFQIALKQGPKYIRNFSDYLTDLSYWFGIERDIKSAENDLIQEAQITTTPSNNIKGAKSKLIDLLIGPNGYHIKGNQVVSNKEYDMNLASNLFNFRHIITTRDYLAKRENEQTLIPKNSSIIDIHIDSKEKYCREYNFKLERFL